MFKNLLNILLFKLSFNILLIIVNFIKEKYDQITLAYRK